MYPAEQEATAHHDPNFGSLDGFFADVCVVITPEDGRCLRVLHRWHVTHGQAIDLSSVKPRTVILLGNDCALQRQSRRVPRP